MKDRQGNLFRFQSLHVLFLAQQKCYDEGIKKEGFVLPTTQEYAHQLAIAIRESEDFKTLKEAMEQIEKEDTSQKMLDDFRQLQMELQLKQMQGQQITQEEQQKAQRLFETISLNPTISKFLQAEQRLGTVMEDINKIVMGPLAEIYGEPGQ
jgi:cell fate (sporulation/competence/biofilm development) regulator YlbF (YheA/YmcA/DUF963 family)